jgi:hypothetical protein
VSKLEQQFDAVTKLPKGEQRIVARFLDTMIAGSATG